MTAEFEKRLARLEAAHASAEQLTVIIRRLGNGPWKGEPARVCELLTGRTWTRGEDESAKTFTDRIETEGGPRVAEKKESA